jgi:peroxiredoxin
MKRIFIASALLLAALTSCQSSKVNISGRFVGTQADMVYLEQTTALEHILLDSVRLDEEGHFNIKLDKVAATPSLYNVIIDQERIPLLLAGGDDIEINAAGKVSRNYTVEGSKESELLQIFNQSYIEGAMQLNSIIAKISEDLSEEQVKAISAEYSRLYLDIKKAQLHFIVENKSHIAAIYALHQRLPNDPYLFNGNSDVIYYRAVAEAVAEVYPDSPYLPILRSQIARMEAQIKLLSEIQESDIPEIKIPDMFGKDRSLTDLEGQVVLLHFWSAAAGNSNAMNADLKDLYAKYHDQGFEIYQVAVDTSKAIWINAIQEQKLPWISVCDLKGEASPTLGEYNVRKLPANYLINRNGQIVGKDLAGKDLENEIKRHI